MLWQTNLAQKLWKMLEVPRENEYSVIVNEHEGPLVTSTRPPGPTKLFHGAL